MRWKLGRRDKADLESRGPSPPPPCLVNESGSGSPPGFYFLETVLVWTGLGRDWKLIKRYYGRETMTSGTKINSVGNVKWGLNPCLAVERRK